MKKQLVNFDFNGNAVRGYVDKEGVTWFVAVDVCAALDIKNPTVAVAKLNSDEKRVIDFSTLCSTNGENQTINIVSESGLYYLVFKSRKPQAALELRRVISYESTMRKFS